MSVRTRRTRTVNLRKQSLSLTDARNVSHQLRFGRQGQSLLEKLIHGWAANSGGAVDRGFVGIGWHAADQCVNLVSIVVGGALGGRLVGLGAR